MDTVVHVADTLAILCTFSADFRTFIRDTVMGIVVHEKFSLLEANLSRFSLGRLDGEGDRRARHYRAFRVSLQRILALRRKGKGLAATAADDERRCSEAVCRDRLWCVRNEDVERDR